MFICLSPPHNSELLPALWTKCKAGGTELELTQPEKMVGLLKGSHLWGSVLLTSRSAVKLSLDGCSSCSQKKFALLHSELTSGNCFADSKNKLPRKTFNSVLCEELELGRVAAAVPCALNTFLSQNRELCVSIIWLHVCTHFLLAQLIL